MRCVRVNDALAGLTSCSTDDCFGQPMSAVLPTLVPELFDLCGEVFRSKKAALNVELMSHAVAPGEPQRYWLASVYPTSISPRFSTV